MENNIKKIFNLLNNQSFITVILFVLIFYVIFYQYLELYNKQKIFNTITNPFCFIFMVVFICILIYNNLTIGILLLFCFILSLTVNKKKEPYKNFVNDNLKKITKSINSQFENGIKENKLIEEKFNKTIKNTKNTKRKENISIKKRNFNLNNQEHKNLLYTKEVLREIVNRINYEYEDIDYLKRYIGNKFEEIIDLLDLLKDE